MTVDEGDSSLEISAAAMDELSSQAVALVSEYFERIAELPIFPETTGGETTLRLGEDLPLKGEPLGKLINDCRAIIDRSRHNGHPRFFGYVASPATAPGVFADLIASALNQNVTSWRSTPAGTEVEKQVVRWLGSLIGFDEHSQGLLTSGGSMANLNALLMALRTKAVGNPAHSGLWHSGPKMTLYASDQIHMSIAKAATCWVLGASSCD